jgi:precorrin-2/cobalt-factor-2 C20-methyltransferase
MKGKFYGIGVGPGDPELLTIKAYRLLQQVDVLCIPKSRMEKESLALNVVRQSLDRDFRVLELLFPMSHDEEVLATHWDRAAEQVAAELAAGHNVAFITIGDPMFYSTYAYLLQRVRKDPEVEVLTVPGVTAFAACASMINEPLTEKDERVAVIPAAYNLEDLREVLKSFDNLVLMKVNRNYDAVVDLLEETGLLDRAVYVSRCGYPDQFYTTDIKSLVGKEKDYMSVLIVRKAGWRGLQ